MAAASRWKPGVDVVLDRPRDLGVHHLERGGHDPSGDDAAHGRGRVFHPREVGEQRSNGRRIGGQAYGDASGDPHRPLAADERSPKVVTRRVGLEAAQQREFTIGEHDLDGQHVRARDAVEEAVRPTRVVGHVATDRARLLARRVGREVQAVLGHGSGQIQVEHARLDPRDTVVDVDVEDAVHLGGHHHHRWTIRIAAHRHCTAGQPRPRSPRDDRPPVDPRHPNDGLNLLGGPGETHRRGRSLDHGGIAGVEGQRQRLVEHSERLEHSAKVGDERRIGHGSVEVGDGGSGSGKDGAEIGESGRRS